MTPRKLPHTEASPDRQAIGHVLHSSLVGLIGKYSLVSLSFAVTAYLMFIALVEISALEPTYAILFSQLCVLPFAYITTRKQVFRSNATVLRSVALYFLGYMSSMAFQWLNIFTFYGWLRFPPYAVAAWGIVISFPLFFVYQKLIFSGPKLAKRKLPKLQAI